MEYRAEIVIETMDHTCQSSIAIANLQIAVCDAERANEVECPIDRSACRVAHPSRER